MKRNRALMASLMLGTGMLSLLFLLVTGTGGRGLPTVLAHPITVDAGISDWIATFPVPPVDNGHVMRDDSYEGEFIWNDASADERTVFANPDPGVDLVEFRVTADETNLYFLAVMEDITIASGAGAPMLQVALDLNRNGTGNLAFTGGATTTVSSMARWEYLATTRFGSGNGDVRLINNGFPATNVGNAVLSADTESIEFSIPWSELGFTTVPFIPVTPIRFTVATFRSTATDDVQLPPGNGNAVLDAISMQSGGTAAEVTDGNVGYYFDVYFDRDGDPTSPLQISEVFYDPQGDTAFDELSNEFVELHNPAQYMAYLDGKVLGDEISDDSPYIDKHEANFQFPGNPLTGTTYAVQPGEYVVVAVDARPYDEDPNFPDQHWADWELFQNLTGEYDNPNVPNLTRVWGASAGSWQDNEFALGTDNGDNVILADGSATDLTTLSYSGALSETIVDGMNYKYWEDDQAPADTSIPELGPFKNGPTAPTGQSLQRDYSRVNPDTNNSNTDFGAGAPTPGFANGLIDHAIYKTGPQSVRAGEVFTYYLYYQIAGAAAPGAVVTDVLPNGVSFVSFDASDVSVTIDDTNEPTLVANLGNVPAGSVGKITVTVELTTNIQNGVVLMQQASIGSGATLTEGILTNNIAVVSSVVQAAVLDITKTVETAHTPALLGDLVNYRLELVNSGDADALGILITDTLPAALVGDDLYIMRDATAGETVTVTYTAHVTDDAAFYGQTVANTAFFSFENGTGSDSAEFVIAGAPELLMDKLVKALQAPVPLGGVVTYTIAITNTSPSVANAVVLTDALPAGVTFGGWVDQGSAMLSPAQDTITWGPWDIMGEEVHMFSFTVTVTSDDSYYGQDIVNTAVYTSGDAGSGEVQATFTIESGPAPDLTGSTKSSSAPSQQLMPGDLVTYTVTLENTGEVAASTTVTDVLGSYFEVQDAMDFDQPVPGTLTWAGTVNSGEQVELMFVVQVVDLADLPIGVTTLTNRLLVNDGSHAVFAITDQAPPRVERQGVLLPLIMHQP